MATRNHSRGTRTIVRSGGNRPRTNPSGGPRRKPVGKPIASKAGSRSGDLHDALPDITRHLQVISAVAVTSEVALKAQNCEQDADIALCLRHGVVDALTAQIERMGRLFRLTRSAEGSVPGDAS
jgi:hypothetical protein